MATFILIPYVFCEPANEMLPAFHARKRLEAESAPVRVVQAPHDLILTHPDLVTALLTGIAHGAEPHAKAGSLHRKPETRVAFPNDGMEIAFRA